MSQQGGRPTGPEDDWWGQLYDDATGDTGPAPAPDSLDDRFASASGTLNTGQSPPVPAAKVPAPRPTPAPPSRAPWEPPPATPPDPVTFPPEARRPPESQPPVAADGGAPLNPPRPPQNPPPRPEQDPPPPTGQVPPPPAGQAPPSRPEQDLPVSTGRDAPPRPQQDPPPLAGRDAPPPTGQVPPPPARQDAPPRPEQDLPVSTGRDAPPRPQQDPRPLAGRDAPPPTGQVPPPPARQVPPPPAGQAPPRPARQDAPPRPEQDPPVSTGQDVPPRPQEDPPPPLPPMAFGTWTPFPASAPPARATPEPGDAPAPAGPRPSRLEPPPGPPPSRGFVGPRPPTYDAEPTALPAADPDDLDGLVPDTVLDGARYGACTLRAASVRGDSARYRGEPRRDALLTARFGTGEQALLLVALATGARTAPRAHLAAAEACRWIGRAVGRSHARLVDDIRAARRGDLKSGLHRLTDRSLGRLRAGAAEQGLEPDAYAATLRCLLLPADPECRTRVFFGVGPGGLFRLRDGAWQDIEPEVTEVKGEPVVGFGSPPSETPQGDRLTMDLGLPTPPSPYEPAPEPPREPFRFRTSVARPGDTLLMCGTGLADPLRGEEELRTHLADRWSRPEPPGLAAFLTDTQVRVKGYADDRTAVAVWEA
ncbi:protein phosphatase 2C domain-containing protein [Streptomyces marokkonensis]|uniref:Protein phosphatase 2C domain-containing protein n=1 Tax=Streptomyces marokkonensis TaxID=324855 RepID=A0ABW6PYE5_9ACTN